MHNPGPLGESLARRSIESALVHSQRHDADRINKLFGGPRRLLDFVKKTTLKTNASLIIGLGRPKNAVQKDRLRLLEQSFLAPRL